MRCDTEGSRQGTTSNHFTSTSPTLFPLETVEESDESELSGTEDAGEDNVTPEEDDVAPKTSTEEETRRRPSRIAAQVARDRLLAQTLADN